MSYNETNLGVMATALSDLPKPPTVTGRLGFADRYRLFTSHFSGCSTILDNRLSRDPGSEFFSVPYVPIFLPVVFISQPGHRAQRGGGMKDRT